MALLTGNQLRAARALVGVDQTYVAKAAGLNVNTVRNMEAQGFEPIKSSMANVLAVQESLEALGVVFVEALPGVLLGMMRARGFPVDNGEWLVDIRRAHKGGEDSIMLVPIPRAREMAEYAEQRGD